MTAVLKIGDKAPDFTLPGDSETSISLFSLEGKNIVLYFYPKDDTSGCTKESIEFNQLRKDFEKVNTVILGMSPDSAKSHDKFKNMISAFRLQQTRAKPRWKPMVFGSRKACTARSIWGLNGRPS